MERQLAVIVPDADARRPQRIRLCEKIRDRAADGESGLVRCAHDTVVVSSKRVCERAAFSLQLPLAAPPGFAQLALELIIGELCEVHV